MYRNRRSLSTLCVFAFQAAMVGAAYAQPAAGNKESSPVDPTGSWKWQYERDGNTAEFKLKLAWDDKELTGKYTGFDRTTDIEVTRLEKDELSFITKREFNGNEFVVEFGGKVKPDEIDGTMKFDLGGEPREFDWNAKRAVEIDDVVGEWNLRVISPNGVIEPRLTITADGDELRGKSVTEAFGELEAKNVELTDNTLSWEISVENNGAQFQVKYSGKPRGNTIEGTNEFSVGDNTGTMRFTGKRTPPKQDEEQAAEDKAAERTPADDSAAARSGINPE